MKDTLIYQRLHADSTEVTMTPVEIDKKFPNLLMKKKRFVLIYKEFAEEYGLEEQQILDLYNIMYDVYHEFPLRDPRVHYPINSRHGATYQTYLFRHEQKVRERENAFYHRVEMYWHESGVFDLQRIVDRIQSMESVSHEQAFERALEWKQTCRELIMVDFYRILRDEEKS